MMLSHIFTFATGSSCISFLSFNESAELLHMEDGKILDFIMKLNFSLFFFPDPMDDNKDDEVRRMKKKF